MLHVAFIPFTGLRVKEQALLALGMSLPGFSQRGSALAELPALGLLTLAGLTPPQWTCSYHEANRFDGALAEQVAESRPSLVAVSALTASIGEAYRFCDAMRQRSIPVVLGGLHATVCPNEVLGHCDTVVVGEGEPVWQALLEDTANRRLKPVYNSSNDFDLKQSQTPRFKLLGDLQRSRMTLQTQRGCPFACDFCAASRLLGKFREKPVANIIAELDAISQIAPNPWLELADDNTFAGPRQTDELLAALQSSGARYFTEVDWRIGERPDLLRGLASSGCVQVLVGIESFVFRYQGMGAKQAEFTRIMDAIRAIQEAGVVVNGCFIVGADGETDESLDRLARFIDDSPLAEIQLTLQTPFPGTPLYDRLRQQGRLLSDRDWSYYTLFDVTYQPDSMEVEELERGFKRLAQSVFSAPASARRGKLRRGIWRRNGRLRRTNLTPSP